MSIDGFGRRPSSQLEVNGQGPRERQQSYVLFEGKDGDGEKFLHVQRESWMRGLVLLFSQGLWLSYEHI